MAKWSWRAVVEPHFSVIVASVRQLFSFMLLFVSSKIQHHCANLNFVTTAAMKALSAIGLFNRGGMSAKQIRLNSTQSGAKEVSPHVSFARTLKDTANT